ncbi:MAG: HAMP domain-containing protein [Chloroflexi bacterium]|nr:HAMP domain-containing protein [Chloroflexota bacterium]
MSEPPRIQPERIGPGYSFRARLTGGMIAGAVIPLAVFGFVIIGVETVRNGGLDATMGGLVLFALAVAVLLGVVFAYLLAGNLTAPLRAIGQAVERVSGGDLAVRVEVAGEDELAQLVESHNRLAADLSRRNAELGRLLVAIGETSPRDGLERLTAHATSSARTAFSMIDAAIHLGDPSEVPGEEVIPGESRPVRAMLALPDERLGVLVGHLPATRRWDPADQDLLELYASEVAVAIRNAQLFEQVEAQTRQLMALDAAKDDFLRGISHNLQTPLTSIRAYADQLDGERPDPRLTIITEQADRLSRMVRQLLAASRLEAGTLKPRLEVLALGPRVRRAWDALGAAEVPFELHDAAEGWLAVADADQLDQVLWALLDNAVKYGRGTPVSADVRPDPATGRLLLTIADGGPGIAEADRPRLFERFARGSTDGQPQGTGIGLYVSRELLRTMKGTLELADATAAGRAGAAFTIALPGESASRSEE